MYVVGVIDDPAKAGGAIDVAAARRLRRARKRRDRAAQERGRPPAARGLWRSPIAVIGGHADAGVLSGGGSTQVMGYGGEPLCSP